jgi:membrane fusion protein, multidrug efflux system
MKEASHLIRQTLGPFMGDHRTAWFAFALLVSATLSGCGSQQESSAKSLTKAGRDAIPVTVSPVVRKSIPLSVEGIGNVEALATVAVKSRVDGQIMHVHFRDGADVARGQVLFEIDPRPAIAQMKQAEAALARDLAQLEHARAQDERYKDLLQKGFISPDFYGQVKSTLDGAAANVAADRATVDTARLQVEYSTIRAPLSGRVGKVLIQQGNLVKANDANPLVTINQLSPIYVSFAVPEQYLPQIRGAMTGKALPAEIVVTDANGKQFRVTGQLGFIDNAVDAGTGTVRLRVSVPNKDAALWPGQFVHAMIALGEQTDALVTPSDAVQTGPKGSYVFVVDDSGKANLRDVVVDRVAGRETIIVKGLAAGEQVVVDGQSRLLPGSTVKILPAKAS